MARIPMTAREQLEAAHRYGHDLHLETRGPWPEHDDPHPKYYLSCTCGWKAKGAYRSMVGVNSNMVRHLVRAIGEGMEADQQRHRAAQRAGARSDHGDATSSTATG